MSLTCGFYNSSNGDRKYNTTQISQIFDGIISDGVYQSIGDAMMVKAGSGMRVNIGVGRAWFNHTWSYNDALYPINIKAAEVVLDRISTVVLKIDTSRTIRNNTFEVIDGTPASAPKPPELKNTAEVFYKPLADIYVKAGTAAITQENITNRVGSDACPFVTGIVQSISAEKLTAQWQEQFNRMFADLEAKIEQAASGTIIDGSVTRSKIADEAVTTDVGFTITTNWSGSNPYKQTISVPEMTSTGQPVLDILLSDTYSTAVQEKEEYGKILKIKCNNGSVEVWASEKTEVPLNIYGRVIYK